MIVDVPRAAALAVCAIALAGYVLVLRPLETAIAGRYATLENARATLVQRLARARTIPALETERIRRAQRLRQLHLGEHRAEVVERFLRTVADVSGRDAVTVESVAAPAAQPLPMKNAATAGPFFESVALDVTLRGRYGDVIRAARDLNAADAVARLTLASLGNAQTQRGRPQQLNAAFHVALLREADEPTPAPARAL